MTHPAIETTRLSKHYGHKIRALESLDLVVRQSEVFGFLGPNGAGKSTTIRLLLGFLRPTSGSGRVLGLDSVRDSVAIRRRIGYLPGGIALYDTLSGERLLDYLAELTGRPPVRRRELCDRLELSSSTLKRLVRDYSRGMRQKIGIVQALQHDPELAILDEPSEGLDPLMQRAFYEILDALKAEGRTIFFSSHVLSEVERVCDRVAIVRQGRLVALEETAQLLARRKRNVQMRFSGVPPRLESVPGVSAVEYRDGLGGGPQGGLPGGPHGGPKGPHYIRCRVEGDVGPFLAAIAGVAVEDLTIEPARLEEAFLEFYDELSTPLGPVAGPR
jgi:ABC-2 type transport system ATP-binding protein